LHSCFAFVFCIRGFNPCFASGVDIRVLHPWFQSLFCIWAPLFSGHRPPRWVTDFFGVSD
jgi:hypothetical protein